MRQAWIYNYWHWCSFHKRLVLHNLPGKQIPDAEVFFRKLTANIFKVLTFHLTKIKTTDAQRTPIIVNSNVKHLGYNNHGPWHFVQSCLAALRWKRCCQQLTRIRTTRSTTVSSGWEKKCYLLSQWESLTRSFRWFVQVMLGAIPLFMADCPQFSNSSSK